LPKELVVNGRKKRIAVVGAVALGVVAIAGTALGAGTDSSSSFLNDFAHRLGVSPAKVKSAYQGAMSDRLDALVKEGKLTQAQANKLKARMKDHTFGGPGAGGPMLGGPMGGPGHHGWGGGGRHMRGGPMIGLMAASKYLGITNAELFKELRAGKTPAAIATAHGKTAAGLEAALMAPVTNGLNAAVKAGKLTKAQAAKFEARMRQHINDLVTHGFQHHGFGDGPPSAPGTGSGSGSGGGETPSSQPTAAAAA
jgi:hypothetical protein